MKPLKKVTQKTQNEYKTLPLQEKKRMPLL